MRLFISAENMDDPLAATMLASLLASGWQVEHSPHSTDRDADPRWSDWYARGCTEALSRADVFLAVVTPGWDGSTWMAHEAETALDSGVPLFIWNPRKVAIPLGMRPYAERPLGKSLVAATAELDAYRGNPRTQLDRHLARLARFIARLPGCPEWSDVLLGENLSPDASRKELATPSAYAARFNELLATCSWINLQAAGLVQQHLVVSVESSRPHGSAECLASVQLAGPEASIAARSGWALGQPTRR